MRLSHLIQYMIAAMFRSNFQLTAGMFPYQFPKKSVIWVGKQIIKPDAGTDKYLLHFWQLPQAAQQFHIIPVVCVQIRTRLRKQALPVLANPFRQLFFTGRMTEIGRRSANIMNIAFKLRILSHLPGLRQNGCMTSRLDNPALVHCQRAEIAAAKAATVAHKTEFYL